MSEIESQTAPEAPTVDDALPAPRPKRGFAALTPERRAELSSRGGKAAHAKGTAHKYNSETGRIAGAKGGAAARDKKRQNSL